MSQCSKLQFVHDLQLKESKIKYVLWISMKEMFKEVGFREEDLSNACAIDLCYSSTLLIPCLVWSSLLHSHIVLLHLFTTFLTWCLVFALVCALLYHHKSKNALKYNLWADRPRLLYDVWSFPSMLACILPPTCDPSVIIAFEFFNSDSLLVTYLLISAFSLNAEFYS